MLITLLAKRKQNKTKNNNSTHENSTHIIAGSGENPDVNVLNIVFLDLSNMYRWRAKFHIRDINKCRYLQENIFKASATSSSDFFSQRWSSTFLSKKKWGKLTKLRNLGTRCKSKSNIPYSTLGRRHIVLSILNSLMSFITGRLSPGESWVKR